MQTRAAPTLPTATIVLLLAATSAAAGIHAPQTPPAPLHPSNLELLQGVAPLMGAPADDPSPILNALEAASISLEARASLLGSLLDPSIEPLFEQQRANIRTARLLLETMEDDQVPDRLPKAVALAQIASRHQAGLGVDLPLPPLPVHTLPSEAALDVAKALGVEPTTEEVERARELDELEPDLRDALTRVLDAFLHFHYAALTTVSWGAGPGLLSVMAARSELLAAAHEMHSTLQEVEHLGPCDPVQIPFAFSIDLTECNNEYVDNLAFLIDAGGNDKYLNNAGGNNLNGGSFGYVAAALIDFGGNDQYGDPEAPRGRGVNGGGQDGAGFLLDAGGNDRYFAGQTGTNGGGSFGAGFLLDAGGSDVYNATSGAVNGGGDAGTGLLVDVGLESDVYNATGLGVNGGAFIDGWGFLLDTGGDDWYGYRSYGANGGGALGRGFLLDGGGSDQYVISYDGDREAVWEQDLGVAGVNGGGALGGAGFLVDVDGDDFYEGNRIGANGGAHSKTVALLVDGGGSDFYSADGGGVNGGAYAGGAAALIDWSGDDRYRGATADGGGGHGANGGAFVGAGLLLDRGGSDVYRADARGVNGGVAGLCEILSACTGDDEGGVALLLDGRGSDWYEDGEGGTGADRTVVPKGILGAQVDLPLFQVPYSVAEPALAEALREVRP